MVNDNDDPELQLLSSGSLDNRIGSSPLQHELHNSPLVTQAAAIQLPNVFPQRGLLGSVLQLRGNGFPTTPQDKRVYINTSAPCSAVVCGVQVNRLTLDFIFFTEARPPGLWQKPHRIMSFRMQFDKRQPNR
jgi:hypothetical protein